MEPMRESRTVSLPCAISLEILRHFHADVSPANHNRGLRCGLLEIPLDVHGIGNVPQGEHVRCVNPFDIRADRLRAGGKNQLVIAFLIGCAGFQIPHGDGFFSAGWI